MADKKKKWVPPWLSKKDDDKGGKKKGKGGKLAGKANKKGGFPFKKKDKK